MCHDDSLVHRASEGKTPGVVRAVGRSPFGLRRKAAECLWPIDFSGGVWRHRWENLLKVTGDTVMVMKLHKVMVTR